MMGSDPITTPEDPEEIERQLAAMDGDAVAAVARRLEEDDYADAFAGLQDWHLLRALAIRRPDLVQPYRHLIDQEPFDED
ncbi:MAG: hypothetical protein TQ37_04705 [Candidatus Synechococcus spongiarum 15L]|uniref:DUF2555 domain-containing protein n=3 Tax=Candidatus Synechococcus spongiarum TaxID=431041 RepID=A0A1T1D251_9SYNE|nr:MAG: hypothetical protein TQ37_04705 [Candidatus Synechococcus spongiarum 15L]OOV34917.1 hypothetical protein BV61_01845 [Candidatus Synechococcus spongiarum LMB bulk15M]OOV36212.1 hypothetical protein BV53_01575 [Candidatus Synechococcus spongiarum LMB bulk15N]